MIHTELRIINHTEMSLICGIKKYMQIIKINACKISTTSKLNNHLRLKRGILIITTMDKPVTFRQLKDALSPIMTAIEELKEQFGTSGEQSTELYMMVSHICARADMYDQSTEEKKPTPKKKKQTKSTETKTDDTETKTDDTDTKTDDTETKPPVKKRNIPKKKSTKSKRAINKMEYFNKMYESDPNYFNTFITNKVKASLEEKYSDEWNELSEDKLEQEKKKVYYKYMTKHHDSQLIDMKRVYIHDKNKPNHKIIKTEDSDEE